MTYNIFSSHAPSGETATRVVSPNESAPEGRVIGYPTNLDLYVQLLSDRDGSSSVVENRKVTDLVGSRLYLFHRPLVNANGTVTTITVSDGTIDATFTNPSTAYIVFSILPTSDFTVSYVAVPDCDYTWSINNLQNSVMELEQVLGPTNDAGYPGIRNLKLGLFDSPTGEVSLNVLQNGVFLSDLDQDITIASSADATLQLTRGDSHTIQLGRETDNVIIDATGLTVLQSDGSKSVDIKLGLGTGDSISWIGSASGAGRLTLGGPEWPAIYSGAMFTTGLTSGFYDQSVLRVHGSASFMGDIKAIGNITVVNTTGSTSTVLGDWTVRDELFVYGTSHLIGETETNDLTVKQQLNIQRDIIADNVNGSGGFGQSLVDNLDCSEVALSYRYVIKNYKPNTVLSTVIKTGHVSPKNTTYRPWMTIDNTKLVGDIFAITGQLNAAASFSGAHPNILQLLLDVEIASGSYGSIGTSSGTWSPGMMDPGSMTVRMLDGNAAGYEAPIYGYTVEGTTGNTLTRLNVFLPEEFIITPQTNDKYVLYNPLSVQYNTMTAEGGVTPTVTINGSIENPIAISFKDEIRILNTQYGPLSILDALEASVSGLAGAPVTGIAYIFADCNYVDPEDPPIFKARATPIRMKNQTAIGEVVASFSGSTWTILEDISYRPDGVYDSAWIPIWPNNSEKDIEGRIVPGHDSSSLNPLKVYFHHYLGSDVDIGKINADLYLGSPNGATNKWNRTHTPMYSFFGQDSRAEHGLSGSFMHIPLTTSRGSTLSTARDASMFYLDSAVIGVDLSPGLLASLPTGSVGSNTAPNYLRLVIRKDN